MPTVTTTFIRNIAESLIGTPYGHLGRNPNVALDCYGLCIEVYRRLGITLPDPVIYPKHIAHDHITSHQDRAFMRYDSPEPGDLVSMRVNSKNPNHLAVMLDKTYILNCSEGAGVHLLRMFPVRKHIVQFLRHPDMIVTL